MLKASSYKDFSKLDLLEQLNLLEELLIFKLTNKNKKKVTEANFNSSLKLLLEIIKLKHKIKPQSTEINFLSLLKFTNDSENTFNN